MRAALRGAGASRTAEAESVVRWAFDEGYREVLLLIDKLDSKIRELLNDFPLPGRVSEEFHFLYVEIGKAFDDADGIILENGHILDAAVDPVQVRGWDLHVRLGGMESAGAPR